MQRVMGCRGVRPRVRHDGLSQEGNQERFAVGSRPSPSRPCCPYPDAMRRCGNQNKRRAARGEKRSRNLCVPKGRRLEDGDGKGRLPTTNHHPFFLSNNLHAKTAEPVPGQPIAWNSPEPNTPRIICPSITTLTTPKKDTV